MQFKKIECDNCKLLFLKNELLIANNTEILIKNKNFLGEVSKLHAPTDLFFEIVTEEVKFFIKYWRKYSYQKNVKQNILNHTLYAIYKIYPQYFTNEYSC